MQQQAKDKAWRGFGPVLSSDLTGNARGTRLPTCSPSDHLHSQREREKHERPQLVNNWLITVLENKLQQMERKHHQQIQLSSTRPFKPSELHQKHSQLPGCCRPAGLRT